MNEYQHWVSDNMFAHLCQFRFDLLCFCRVGFDLACYACVGNDECEGDFPTIFIRYGDDAGVDYVFVVEEMAFEFCVAILWVGAIYYGPGRHTCWCDLETAYFDKFL